MAPVEGAVTIDGKPLERGTVQFVPDRDRETVGPPAVGAISSDGRYELTTAGVRGALVGAHRVRIVARAEPSNPNQSNPSSLIPSRYFRTATSGLTAQVEAGKTNSIDWRLSSDE